MTTGVKVAIGLGSTALLAIVIHQVYFKKDENGLTLANRMAQKGTTTGADGSIQMPNGRFMPAHRVMAAAKKSIIIDGKEYVKKGGSNAWQPK